MKEQAMTENPTHAIKTLVATLFSCAYEDLSDDTGPGDIPKWDSLGHILLLEAMTERFNKEIPIEQAVEAKSISELARLVS